jgi:Tfp pilus assembly protein PilN
MKLNLNLSSNPFVNNRQFYLVAGFLLVAVLGVTYSNVMRYFQAHNQKLETSRVLVQTRSEMDKLELEENQIRARLLRPETADFLEKVEYINRLIDRRTFSWTQLLNDLEELAPLNIQIVSIRPRVLKQEFGIEIIANSKSSADYVGFIANLENSHKFQNVTPIYEDLSKTPGFSGKQVSVAVKYKGEQKE